MESNSKNGYRLLHWGPILASLITLYVTIASIADLCARAYAKGLYLNSVLIFLLFAIASILNFYAAVWTGPGYVPVNWRPLHRKDETFLQHCIVCKNFKAPRSHHCSQCGKCVLKMDHHCIWLNTCVGHYNQKSFISFLFYGIIASILAIVYLGYAIWNNFGVMAYERRYFYAHVSFLFFLPPMGVSVGILFSFSFLLKFQITGIIKNETGIETWIIDKAHERRNIDPTIPEFVYPYDLGWKRNINQVLGLSKKDLSDGIIWPVRDGCTEYDLTKEQLEQKVLKKLRKQPFKVINAYSGSVFPISNGLAAFFHPPCTIESRLPLELNDVIFVTRCRNYWLFGEKYELSSRMKCKGWFPRKCVVPCGEPRIIPQVLHSKKD